MIFVLAWRNLWRNRRRTIITASALALGVAAMAVMLALMDGLIVKMVSTVTNSNIADAQLHAPDYRETLDETLTLEGGQALLERARATEGVEAASGRVITLGLAAIGDRSRGVQLIGVDPEHERRVTNWQERLARGEYLAEPNDVILGVKLAEKLDVEVGSKLVITAANVHTGESTADLFRVRGLLFSGNVVLDEQAAIVTLPQAQEMAGLEDALHEVALRVDAPATDRAAIEAVIAPLDGEDVEAVPWHEIGRMVAETLRLNEAWLDIAIYMLFIILAFGIVNTISMSLLERMHEFGVMRAIGTSPWSLGGLIVVEAAFLGLAGALPGALLGIGFSYWLGSTGIDFSGTTMYGMAIVEPIYPIPNIPGALRVALIFSALTTLTSIYSAVRAARVEPVEAMRGMT